MKKTIQAYAIGRERAPEEKLRRHLYGDKGAKFSQGKRYCIIGEIIGCITTVPSKDNMICVTQDKSTMGKQENKCMLPPELEGKTFRIRKLTPRELFRLMGVDDQDIDKIQATGISDSAQKKLAGNSIVVDVLYHIFRKMFVEKENENRQLTLF